jgi:probable phosphoglycerate mutase
VTTLLLVRHGETDWNRERRFQGHADPGLNDAGREQARALAEELATEPVAAVYTSDLRRALETAEIVAARLGLEPAPLAGLREVDVGELTGLTLAEIEERFPDARRRAEERGYGWEQGETFEQLQARVLSALHEIAARHAGELVLVVGHGGTIRATLAHADGLDLVAHRRLLGPAANCAVYRVAIENGSVTRLD